MTLNLHISGGSAGSLSAGPRRDEPTDADYEAAARWAETADFDPDHPTVERGRAAAETGRALLCAASGDTGDADVANAVAGLAQAFEAGAAHPRQFLVALAELARGAADTAAAADAPEPTDADYEAAARWAETATFADAAVETGPSAAAAGRALLRAARTGRPALDVANEPGQSSPVRRFRLPVTLDAELNAYLTIRAARGEKTTASDVMREALAEYLRAHPAS